MSDFSLKALKPILSDNNFSIKVAIIDNRPKLRLKQKLKKKLAELERKIRETEKRLPAHSVKPPIMTELLDLEDEYEAVFAQLKALKTDQPDSKQ